MSETFIRVDEVAQELGVSKPYAYKLVQKLNEEAVTIKILDLTQILPDIPEKGDITDFVRSVVNTEEAQKHINWLIEQTKEYRVTENLEAGRLVRMSDIEEREVDWLWKPYIPYRKITIFRGDPGLGKTYFVLTVASIVSNGWSFPDMANSGFKPTTESNVLFLTAEDDLEDTIKPRLRLAKANMDKIFSFTDYITFSDPRFEGLLKKVSPRLVIIDPLQAFLGEGVDMHRANEIRPIFSYIRQLAEKYNFALIILEHLNKNIGGKAIYRGLGSMDITGAARSILMFGCDPEDDSKKGFMHAKSNLDKKGEIVGFSITSNGLEWNPHTTLTADMILGGGTSKTGRPSREVDEAVEFLKILLEGNLVTSDEVYKKAEAKGISRRTLERAKKEACVDSVQKDRKWYWFIK